MKTNLTKYALIGLTLLMLGCSRSSEDYADENYEKLFPFHGIERSPMKIKSCNWVIPMHLFQTMYTRE